MLYRKKNIFPTLFRTHDALLNTQDLENTFGPVLHVVMLGA